MSKRIAVTQLGARMHYAVPSILNDADLLECLFTDIYVGRGVHNFLASIGRLLPASDLRRLGQRHAPALRSATIKQSPMLALTYKAMLKTAKSQEEKMRAFIWAEKSFGEWILRNGFGRADYVYGYNTSSRSVFEGAHKRGIGCILEQTIAPKSVELEILRPILPEREFYELLKAAEPLVEIESREWDMATKIICPSDFVLDSLITCGVDPKKCVLAPYGVDLEPFQRQNPRMFDQGPITALFIGAATQRKGIATLIEAMRLLEGQGVQCRIVGSLLKKDSGLIADLPENTKFIGPVARSEVQKELASADVFCLPSFCEGSATVVYEALAAGLPVITTTNTGSIIRDGVEGLIVSAGDVSELAEALLSMKQFPELRGKFARNASERSTFGSFTSYRERLMAIIASL